MSHSERVLNNIREFYNRFPFPGYEVTEYYTASGLVDRASQYVRAIDEQIPPGTSVLDIGCGTGQFACMLALRGRDVTGIDLSASSIKKAIELKEQLNIHRVTFLERNLFELDLPLDAFDYVFCNGVLHHTADPFGGFQIMVNLAKPGGYVIVGLYNTYGRLLLRARRVLFRLFKTTPGKGLAVLDFFMRRDDLSETQKRVWFEDQYHNPHETAHSAGEVLKWFDQTGVRFVSGIPDLRLYGMSSRRYFDPAARTPSQLEVLIAQLGWIISTDKEGGYFLMIGQRQ